MKKMIIWLFLAIVIQLSCIDVPPGDSTSTGVEQINYNDYSEVARYSEEQAYIDVSKKNIVGDYIVGFLQGFSYPFLSTLTISSSDLGVYPDNIPSGTDPNLYRMKYYNQMSIKRKQAMVQASFIGSIIPTMTIYFIVKSVYEEE